MKLGSLKEFRALNSNELKGIEGGILWPAVFFMITTGIYLYDRRSEFIEGFKKGYNGKIRFNMKDNEYYKRKYKRLYWTTTIMFLIILFVYLYDRCN